MDLRQYATATEMIEGEHRLAVTGVREYEASTGIEMIDIFLRNKEGSTMRHGFAKTPRGLRTLASFATCVVPTINLADFEAEQLAGCTFVGTVERNDQGYLVLTNWRPDDTQPTAARADVETTGLF